MKLAFTLLLFTTNAFAAGISYSCAEAPAARPVEVKIDESGQLTWGDGITADATEEGCRPAGKGGRLYRIISGMAFIFIRVPAEAFAGAAQFKMTAALHGVNGMGPACAPHRLVCVRRE